jgi:superfamily II DNA or RNA helicase
MFSKLKRIFGNITIVAKNGVYLVEGVPADVITHDIRKVWGTNRINQNLFVEINPDSFSFYEFFAVEVYYALERLIEEPYTKVSRHTLRAICEKLLEQTWLVKRNQVYTSRLNKQALDNFVYNPLDHQEEYFDAYEEKRFKNELCGGLLAGAAGSGKTISFLMLMEMLGKDKVIMVAPSNAVAIVWEKTISTLMKNPPTFWSTQCGRPFTGVEKYIIIHYEYLDTLYKDLHKLKYENLGVGLDESHNFNNKVSLRTELFIKLCEACKSEDVVWLSGTPIKALSTEAIPLLRCIDKKFTPECEVAFKKIFGVSAERATDMIKNRLDGMIFYVPKERLGLNKPLFEEIKVTIPNGHRFTLEVISAEMKVFTDERLNYYAERADQDKNDFDDCLKEHSDKLKTSTEQQNFKHYNLCLAHVIKCGGDARFCAEEMFYCNRYEKSNIIPSLSDSNKKLFKDIKANVKYVKLKVQGECLGRIVGRRRIEANLALVPLVDYIRIIEASEKKTVMFTSYVEVIDALEDKMKELGLQAGYVYAKTNHKLGSIIKEFEVNPDMNPLIATFNSLSTAVPLVMADQCVLLNPPWRDNILQQTISRINRIGETTQTKVYTIALDTDGKPNIANRAVEILKWSQEQIKNITGIQSPYQIDESDIENPTAMEGYVSKGEELDDLIKPNFLNW